MTTTAELLNPPSPRAWHALARHDRIETRRRLVAHEDLGFDDKRARHANAFDHSS